MSKTSSRLRHLERSSWWTRWSFDGDNVEHQCNKFQQDTTWQTTTHTHNLCRNVPATTSSSEQPYQPNPTTTSTGTSSSTKTQQTAVFFDEPAPAQPAPQQQPQQMTADEYNQILMQSFSELLGPAMQDPQVAKAVQEQIEVAVDVTMLEMPEALPQTKLQAMSEKMLLGQQFERHLLRT